MNESGDEGDAFFLWQKGGRYPKVKGTNGFTNLRESLRTCKGEVEDQLMMYNCKNWA